LKWLFNFKDSQGQLARWLEVLSQYDFEIQHRPGSKHQNADALSRKDGDHPLCEHQMKGESNVKCDICISMSEEWSDFSCKVDNVGNLGIGSAIDTIRVVTRSQDKESIQCNWLQGYSNHEIESFQREDLDL
jgi:hypothetical protein